MSDLIVGGVDHSVAREDWIKRGGVIFGTYEFGGNYLYRLVDCSESRDEYLLHPLFCFNEMYNRRLGLRSYFLGRSSIERMATPAECLAAGVDYIKPPMKLSEPVFVSAGFNENGRVSYTWLDYEIEDLGSNRGFHVQSQCLFESIEEAQSWCEADRNERVKALGLDFGGSL